MVKVIVQEKEEKEGKGREYGVKAWNGRWVKEVGEWAYDTDNTAYQWQLLPLPGWYAVKADSLPQPMAHSVKGAKKRGK